VSAERTPQHVRDLTADDHPCQRYQRGAWEDTNRAEMALRNSQLPAARAFLERALESMDKLEARLGELEDQT